MGTAARDARVSNTLVTLLNNIQADMLIVTEMDLTRMSMCRNCPDTMLPGFFNISLCAPCGELIDPTNVSLWWAGQYGGRRLARNSKFVSGNTFVVPFQGDARTVDVSKLPDLTGSQADVAFTSFTSAIKEDSSHVDTSSSYGIGMTPPPSAWDSENEYIGMTPPPSVWKSEPTPFDAAERRLQPFMRQSASASINEARRLQSLSAESIQDVLSLSAEVRAWFKCAPDITQENPSQHPWQPNLGKPCYAAIRQFQGNLECPRGTQSNLGKSEPDDCLQIGEVIAIQNF
jgi:hypothetical protein